MDNLEGRGRDFAREVRRQNPRGFNVKVEYDTDLFRVYQITWTRWDDVKRSYQVSTLVIEDTKLAMDEFVKRITERTMYEFMEYDLRYGTTSPNPPEEDPAPTPEGRR